MRASTRSGEGIAPHRSGVDARRPVAKVEWHPGELYPCVGFIVTNMTTPASAAPPSSKSWMAEETEL